MMRSHIYPQFIIKEWIKNFSLFDPVRFHNFYTIDLYQKRYVVEKITNENKIDKILNQERVFFLHLKNELIKEYEKEWSKKYETPFLTLYNPFLNIHKQYYSGFKLKEGKKYWSYEKEIINRFCSLNKIRDMEIIRNFLILSIFRSNFIKPTSKVINQHGKIFYKNFSELFVNFNISEDKNDIRNSFEKFKKSLNLNNYSIFLLTCNLMFMANPPIYNFDDIFFAIPFPPIGFLCFLKPGYIIKSFCAEEKYEFIFIKSTKIIYNNKGYRSLKSVFDYDESKIELDNIIYWFSCFLMVLWFANYGFNKGEIYFIGNENSIMLFMEDLEFNKFFQKRKKVC